MSGIVATPGTCGGRPRLDGTRVPLETIVRLIRLDRLDEIPDHITADDLALVRAIIQAVDADAPNLWWGLS